MADLFENPMGLDGFEFVEYAAPERGVLEPVSCEHAYYFSESSRVFYCYSDLLWCL